MREENIKVKITIPFPFDKPDKNGNIYSEEAVKNAVNNFTISGTKLTPSSTASLTIDDNTNFSVNPSTIDIDANGNIAPKDVTVTYAPTTTGEHSATLTIASGETCKKTISLSGTGVAPKTHYTVTWRVNGETYTAGTPTIFIIYYSFHNLHI